MVVVVIVVIVVVVFVMGEGGGDCLGSGCCGPLVPNLNVMF